MEVFYRNPFIKKCDPSNINNYRCIYILPVLAKLFKKLINAQMIKYFDDNKLFFSGQHGFRIEYSCESALHEMLSEMKLAKYQRKIVMLLFIYFRKAFDTVDTNLLILNLFH